MRTLKVGPASVPVNGAPVELARRRVDLGRRDELYVVAREVGGHVHFELERMRHPTWRELRDPDCPSPEPELILSLQPLQATELVSALDRVLHVVVRR